MCLSKVTSNEEKLICGVGYKLVRIRGYNWSPPLYFEYSYPLGKWATATNGLIKYDKCKYKSGFHLFPELNNAIEYRLLLAANVGYDCINIHKVRYHTILAEGFERFDYRQLKTLVVKEIMVEECVYPRM